MGRRRKIGWELIKRGLDYRWRSANDMAKKINVDPKYLSRLLSKAAALGLVEKTKKRYRCPVCGATFDEIKRVDNVYPVFRLPSSSAGKKQALDRG